MIRAKEKHKAKKGDRNLEKDSDFRHDIKKKPERGEEVSHDMATCLTSWRKNITVAQKKKESSR